MKFNPTKKQAIAMLAGIAFLSAIHTIKRCGKVDACLDAGGCWDSTSEKCEKTDSTKCK